MWAFIRTPRTTDEKESRKYLDVSTSYKFSPPRWLLLCRPSPRMLLGGTVVVTSSRSSSACQAFDVRNPQPNERSRRQDLKLSNGVGPATVSSRGAPHNEVLVLHRRGNWSRNRNETACSVWISVSEILSSLFNLLGPARPFVSSRCSALP